MGCIKNLIWFGIKLYLFCLVITFLPGIPPYNVEYKAHEVKRPLPLPEKFSQNLYLNNAKRIFEHELLGPEAFAVHNGAVYTGLHGGYVVRIDGDELVPVVKFGKQCEDVSEESVCGRPLGLKFDKDGNLYVADAYYGINKYNMKTAAKTQLVDVDDVIEGKKSKFINDLAIGSDGSVYFTVSSTSFPLENGVQAFLSTGDGRVLKYDPRIRSTSVLLENLYFPNGIVLSPNEDFLLFAETTHLRVMKYYLKGSKKGTLEVLADGLPGAPDNIRTDGNEGYYVSLIVYADERNPFLGQMLANFPNIRRFLSRTISLLEFPFAQVNGFYPNKFCRKAVHFIGHFGPTRAILPKRVTILQLDAQGNIKDALLGTDGSVSHISDIAIVGNSILLGSPYNNYIGKVPLPNAPYQVHIKSVRFTSASEEEAEEAKAKKAADEAAAGKAAEGAKAKKAADEAAARKAAEEAERKAAEEAKAKKAAEEVAAKKAAEEAKAKKAAQEAAARKAADEAAARKAAEKAAAARKAAEEAKAKKAADEAAARKATEEAKAKKAADEAAARKAAEAAKAKKDAEEAVARKAADEAKAKKVAEEAAARRAAEEAKVKNAAKDSGPKNSKHPNNV